MKGRSNVSILASRSDKAGRPETRRPFGFGKNAALAVLLTS
jgi:hypothetical protein